MAIVKSCGREAWIFRVDNPEDLVGTHRQLIASALLPGEAILHLIYAPVWEGKGAPFGFRGISASHAIALTSSRWIISEDLHNPVFEPRVTSIPFDRILVVEKGSALLLAWLAIRFREGETLRTLTVLHKSIGSHHFDDAVRTYRRIAAEAPVAIAISGDPFEWQHIPRYLAQELTPIVGEDERVIASTRTVEQWHEHRRRWRRVERCARPWSALLVTNRGVVYCELETPRQPGLMAFGVNVWCMPSGAVRMTEVRERRLAFILTRGPARFDVEAAIP